MCERIGRLSRLPVVCAIYNRYQADQLVRLTPAASNRSPKTSKVYLIVIMPMHNWSYQAAIIAHYFDSQSKQLGIDFRDYIFEHQPEIFPTNLQQFAQKFAADHKVDLPFVVDPQGKFAAEVNAERDLGKAIAA